MNFIKRLKGLMKNKNGSTYIETVITVLIAVMVIIVGINVFSLLFAHYKVNHIASEMANHIALNGLNQSELDGKLNDLVDNTSFDIDDIDMTVYVNDSTDTSDLNIGDKVTVNINVPYSFQGTGEFIPINMNINISKTKYSQLAVKEVPEDD